jgi:hypothetical protein
MPARSASAGNADGIGRCGLIQRSHRHGLGRGDSRKADADRKQGRSKYFHGLSFLLVREEKMTSGQMSSATLPMAMVAPVMTVMPATVPMPMPAAMPMPVPMAMMMPAHFFRLDVIDFVLRHDGRLDVCASGRRR